MTRSSTGYESVTVSCEGNEHLTGGGAACDGGSKERLKWSLPSGNSWVAACPATNLTVVALCSAN